MVEVSKIMTVLYSNRRDWCLISFLALARRLCAKYQSLLLDNWWLSRVVLKCCFVGWITNYGGIECNVKHLSSIKTVGKDVISIFAFRSWFKINCIFNTCQAFQNVECSMECKAFCARASGSSGAVAHSSPRSRTENTKPIRCLHTPHTGHPEPRCSSWNVSEVNFKRHAK